MSKVMFTISYTVRPEAREHYLAFIKEMKTHLTTAGTKDYAVYEVRGKKNTFMEVFVTQSLEEFDALEDNQDERTQELVGRLNEFLDDEGMKYTTLVQIA